MSKDTSFLKQEATREIVERLFGAGILSPAARLEAVDIVDPPRRWIEWLNSLLLFLGCAFVLSGTVFFFAYNWSAMGKFTKMGLIEALVVLCAILGWRMDGDKLPSKVLILAASVFVGVFLAVFGQIYQTGADAWQLFAGWSILILGWTLVTRFAGLWLFWLIISNVALITYWHQMIDQFFESTFGTFILLLTVLNGGLLVLREVGLSKGIVWLKNNYHRWIVLAYVLLASTSPVLYLSEERYHSNTMVIVAAIVWFFVIGAVYVYYRHFSADLLALTMATGAVCVAILTHLAPFFFSGGDNALLYLIFGFVILAVVGPAALWLKGLGKEMRHNQ